MKNSLTMLQPIAQTEENNEQFVPSASVILREGLQ
jgi:hypothetical protein